MLEEGASLAQRMAEESKKKQPRMVTRYQERAQAKMQQGEVLRKLILESRDAPIELKENAS